MTDSPSSLIETVADGLFDVLANLGMSPTQDDCNIIARAALLAIEGAGYVVMPAKLTDEMIEAHDTAQATAATAIARVSDLYASLLSSRPRVT
jgi:hypothetical protein